jgi:predicted histone-like DNA-binding protein
MGKIIIELYQNNNEKSDNYKNFYGRARKATPVDATTLSEHAASDSNIESSDIANIYDAEFKQIQELACNGHAIQLDGWGTFKLAISSKGVSAADVKARHPEFDPTKEDIRKYLSAKQVKKARLVFIPCQEIKEALRSVKFETDKSEWISDDNNNENNG